MIKSAFANTIPNTHWKVGLYIRLSKEDYSAGGNTDSVSVKNQRTILRKFAKDNGLFVVSEFVDDGYSGTNFDRPSFQQLINAISRKEINCVITKDLSRLGRNHLEVGYYIETFFPENRIRYIAVNEQYDSMNGDSDIVPFMNIMNEMVAKQTSKKNRQVFESKLSGGGMHSRHVSYGYVKDPNDKNHRLIDFEVVDNVRKIFDLAECGYSSYMLQKWLFEHKIECPSYRIYKKTGMFADIFDNCPEERKYKWNTAMLRKMVSDITYLGHSVHYKKRRVSYKNKKQVPRPKEQWMIVKNTHQPIITQEQFDRVQESIKTRKRITKSGSIPLFSGVLRCSDCGGALAKYTREGKSSNRSYYVCIKHSTKDVYEKCSPHYTSERKLEEAVLSRIQDLFAEVKIDKHALAKRILNSRDVQAKRTGEDKRKEAEDLRKRLRLLTKLISKLYEDWASEIISEENFKLLFRNYQEEQETCSNRVEEIERELKAINEEEGTVKQFVELVDHLSRPQHLNRELLRSLVDKIVVHEPIKNDAGTRNSSQQIDIYWKYIGMN